ncbi:MAG: DUF6325 family protein [Ilumatobacteraceae bacterium]
MSIGPVEYIIIGFPGNQFTGNIAPELLALVESGTIRVIDLIFIMKDDAGEIAIVEVDEDEALAAFGTLDAELGEFIGDDDILHAAATMEPGTSVLMVVWEDRWAGPFAEAIRESGGIVLEGARVPRELIEAALAAG